jgi:apolipoprotein D and lipocalin family protein
MKTIITTFMLLSLSCAQAQVVESNLAPIQVVDHVDLDRYAGKWFEIAKYPNRFQRNCTEATAEYTKLPNGKIQVLNTCKRNKDHQVKDILGEATVKDTVTNAKLNVTFLPSWLRWTKIGLGKYWIIDLEPNYEYAVVSEPKREYLWILSRTPSLKSSTYSKILEKIVAQGLDPKKLEFSRENAVRD